MSKHISTKLFGNEMLIPVGKVQAGGGLGYAANTDSNFVAVLIDRDYVKELLTVLKAGEVMGSDVAYSMKLVIESALEDDKAKV